MSASLVITLPVPLRQLSPNSRCHALSKSGITRAHRQSAFFATLKALGVPTVPQRLNFKAKKALGIEGPMTTEQYLRVSRLMLPGLRPAIRTYELRAFFQTNRNRDDDNLEGWAKAYRDGIADALLVNDTHLSLAGKSLGTDARNPRFEFHLYV